MTGTPLVYLVAGEESGDLLGARLMAELAGKAPGVRFAGVGGGRMEARGLASLFPMSDISVMGLTAVLAKLPSILSRINATVRDVLARRPDVLVLIDSPEFTHRVASRVRARAPDIPIVDYVSPSVWAWRPGRAARMRAYVDKVLAILPFEPDVHARLGGPPCVYVGHPLAERMAEALAANPPRRELATVATPMLLVLPGSRMSEVMRLMPVFGETLAHVAARRQGRPFEVVVPAVPHLVEEVERGIADWPIVPRIVTGEAEKYAAFARAHAALASSGTVTLELALAGVPQVVAYRLDWIMRQLNRLRERFPTLAPFETIVLANIVLGTTPIPEFLDEDANPQALGAAVAPLLSTTPARVAQLEAIADIRERMWLPDGRRTAEAAADEVLAMIR